MRLDPIAQQYVYNMDIDLCSGSSLVKIHTHMYVYTHTRTHREYDIISMQKLLS